RPLPAGSGEDRRSATFSPDSRWLAATDTNGFVRIFDLTSEEPARARFSLPCDAVRMLTLSFSLDGRSLIAAGESATTFVWRWAPNGPVGDAIRLRAGTE